VTTQGSTIVIEPANPEVVYVPAYDPWLVYGYPIIAYPGWYPVPGIFWDGVGLSFGIGFASASSEDLGGAGATGDMTGMADERSSTITPLSRIAMSSVTRDSIMVISPRWRPRQWIPWVFEFSRGLGLSRKFQLSRASQERASVRSSGL